MDAVDSGKMLKQRFEQTIRNHLTASTITAQSTKIAQTSNSSTRTQSVAAPGPSSIQLKMDFASFQ
jgi:hypothetical protein